MSKSQLTLPAFAKINLSLRILGKRPDGYHEIDSVLQTVSLHDTLTIEPTSDGQIQFWCDDRSIPVDEKNLVWRAAEALRKRCSIKAGVKIRLEKRIPAQAGLGGGSSDAAATLVALTQLWQIEFTGHDLGEIAGELGSDVPFFLYGGTVRVTGRGNVVETLTDAPEQHFLIIKPNASVSTAEAYTSLNAPALTTSASEPILSRSPASEFSASIDTDALHNDFEPVIFKQEREIERVKNALVKSGARRALLSGSGSAVFGVFENKDAQERAIQAIELEAGWRAFPCKTVGRNQHRRASGPAGGRLARLFGKNAGA